MLWPLKSGIKLQQKYKPTLKFNKIVSKAKSRSTKLKLMNKIFKNGHNYVLKAPKAKPKMVKSQIKVGCSQKPIHKTLICPPQNTKIFNK